VAVMLLTHPSRPVPLDLKKLLTEKKASGGIWPDWKKASAPDTAADPLVSREI
jgi:hypothetical protein